MITGKSQSVRSRAFVRNRILVVSLAILCSFLASLGQLSLRSGSIRSGGDLLLGITSFEVLLGYGLYGVSTLLFIVALKREALSIVYPIVGLTYFWVVLASAFVAPIEPLNAFKVCGSLLVVMGVALVGTTSSG